MGDVSTESFGWATVEVVLDEAFSDWEYKLQGAVPSQLIMLGQDFKSGVDASIETKRLKEFLTTAGLIRVRVLTTRNRWADSLTVNVFATVTQAFLDS